MGPRIQLYMKWGLITPISRVKYPQLPIYKAIYSAYNLIYNW